MRELDKEATGRRLKQLREAAGMTITQVHTKTGMDTRTVKAIEDGTKTITVLHMIRLADIYDMYFDELIVSKESNI